MLIEEIEKRDGKVLDYIVYVRSKRRKPFYLSVDSNWKGGDRSKGVRGIGREVTSKIMVYDGFYQSNKEGRILFCDSTFAKHFEYSPEELIGKNIRILYFDPSKREITYTKLREDHYCLETMLGVTKNKQLIMCELANHVTMQGNSISGVEGSVRTTRIRGVYVIQQNRFVYVDGEFSKIFGRKHEDILSLPSYLDIVAPGSRNLVRKEVDQKLLGGYGKPYEFFGLHKDNSHIRLICDSSLGAFKNKPAVIGYIIESTPERELVKLLQRRIRSATLGEAVNDMTHWLGNVVSPIYLAALFVENHLEDSSVAEPVRSKIVEELDKIKNNVKITVRMKDDLMLKIDASLYERKDIINAETIHDLIQKVLSSISMPSDIKVDIMINQSVKIIDNKNLELFKVFTYIIKNAFEAMPKGGHLKILGDYNIDNDYFEMQLSDTGAGIRHEHQASIFKPFFTTKHLSTQSGAGLGLYYCYYTLSKMDADITFKSEFGQGTTFIINFYNIKKENQYATKD